MQSLKPNHVGFGDFHARLKELGGNPNGVTNTPYVREMALDARLDAILIASDGVTDALMPKNKLRGLLTQSWEEWEAKRWQEPAKSQTIREEEEQQYIDALCKDVVDNSVNDPRWKSSVGADNATVVFIKLNFD